jgi:hypothetical protein
LLIIKGVILKIGENKDSETVKPAIGPAFSKRRGIKAFREGLVKPVNKEVLSDPDKVYADPLSLLSK